MQNLLNVPRSKASMAIATKENISLVKEVFNMTPVDYRVITYVMKYEILKPRDMKLEKQKYFDICQYLRKCFLIVFTENFRMENFTLKYEKTYEQRYCIC